MQIICINFGVFMKNMKLKRRNTPSKEAVLAVLATSGKAMSQDAIEKKIKLAVDRATIYRILNRFCEDGILHKIVAENGKQYFALCVRCDEKELTDNHFHFRCTQCETITCLPIPVHFSLPQGYQVENVNCVLTGVCKECTA
jgi:Fur family ferric uptake transcriptional regulator